MPLTVNTNLASLGAQRHLNSTQAGLGVSMQRLSSGLRVNSAKDDAAGLAIAERMNAQVRGMSVAARNTNDGISLAQTAEGALGKVGDALQRMRELAVQARNGSNASNDKESLNKEFGELAKEIQRVLGGTRFNGKAILGADATSMVFQVGAGTAQDDLLTQDLSNLSTNNALVKVAGSGSPSAATQAAASLAAKNAAVSALSGYPSEAANMSAQWGSPSAPSSPSEAAKAAFKIGMVYNHGAGAAAWAAGVETAASGAQAAQLVHNSLATNNSGAGSPLWDNLAQAVYNAYAAVAPASPPPSIGATASAAAIGSVIDDVDAALTEVNNQRATFGATLSRFEAVVSNLNVSIENQSAARSRIVDADFATETAQLSRSQILQQAGNAMVAQANQQPQQVLSLLR